MTDFRVLGLSWAGVGTDDFAGALRFFTNVLGLRLASGGEDQALLAVGDHGQQIELFGRDGRGKALNTPPTFAFEVDDFDAAHAALLGHGVEIVDGPSAWNGHRWLYFRGPGGYLYEIKTSPDFRAG